MRTQLLCTFTKSRVLSKTVDKIIDTYDILYNKLFVLNNNDNKYAYDYCKHLKKALEIYRLFNSS